MSTLAFSGVFSFEKLSVHMETWRAKIKVLHHLVECDGHGTLNFTKTFTFSHAVLHEGVSKCNIL